MTDCFKTKSIDSAGVAKLADALDLGSSAARHMGSSPFTCTINNISINSSLKTILSNCFFLYYDIIKLNKRSTLYEEICRDFSSIINLMGFSNHPL